MGRIAVLGGEPTLARALSQVLAAQGHDTLPVATTAPDPWDEAGFAANLQGLGPLRGLVCLWTEEPRRGIETLDWQHWRAIMQRNLTLPMLAMKHAQIEDGGAIVLASSCTLASDLAHHAAAGGLLGLARAACGEFAPMGIRVNAVSANTATTTPADMAAAIGFLLSGAASFITGEELVVDGGARRRR